MDERIKAIISAGIIIIVNVLALFNIAINPDIIAKAAFGVAELIATIWAIWKNHNFTLEAAQAQGYLNNLKSGRE